MKLNKALGLDIGSVNTGIAISDSTKTIAFPFKTIKTTKLKEEIEKIIKEESVDIIVIGENLYQNKNFNVREIAKNKLGEINTEITYVNEDFSTEKAKELFKTLNKKNKPNFQEVKDELAAKIILDTYLNEMVAGVGIEPTTSGL